MEQEISGISKFPEKRTTSRGEPKFWKRISGKLLFHSILNRNFRKFLSNGTRPELIDHNLKTEICTSQFSSQNRICKSQFSAQNRICKSQFSVQNRICKSQFSAQNRICKSQFSAQNRICKSQFSAQKPYLWTTI